MPGAHPAWLASVRGRCFERDAAEDFNVFVFKSLLSGHLVRIAWLWLESTSVRTVPLYGEKAAGRVALVDDQDYNVVSSYRWSVYLKKQNSPGSRDNGPYAIANTRRADGHRTTVKMHCLIMGSPGVDHLDHDGLNNQRSNLRLATKPQNMANQRPRVRGASRFKGVTWHNQQGKWRARIKVNGRFHHLGCFDDEENAARAYDVAALAEWGPYAYLNLQGGESVGA